MFLNKFFHFLKGYVILYITGIDVDRFLYICSKRGLEIWDIKKSDRLELKIHFSDFKKIRPIAFKTHSKVHIKQKSGLPVILKKYRKRYIMIFGFMLISVLSIVLSNMIWSVEIDGVNISDEKEIRQVLKEYGIEKWHFKNKNTSFKDIKNSILNRVDNVSWAWVYLKGTKAICKIYEGNIPIKIMDEKKPADIVASRDGVIKSISVKKGVAMVKPGDTVNKGDLLISGTISNASGEISTLVGASGVCEAYTSHYKKGTYKLYHAIEHRNGNVNTKYHIEFFGKSYNLPKYKKKKFVFYDSKTERFGVYPIVFVSEKQFEKDVLKEPITLDTAIYEARCDLEEKLAHELSPAAELVKEDIYHAKISEDTIEVMVSMELLENISLKIEK